jgi:peptidoglycan/xylan/chitin deacetylase (PgdA/CDA1 family)
VSGTTLLRGLARILPARALRPFGRPLAVHFHGVVPRIEDPRIQFNHFPKDDFRRMAVALKAAYQVLPLSALAEVLKAPERFPRAAFLMADDGYRNTLTEAADILDGLGLPWTLFVSTHHIDTGELVPTTAARLFYWFAPARRHAIPHLGPPVDLSDAGRRTRAARRGLAVMRKLDPVRGRETVDAMMAALGASLLGEMRERFASERFLNWPEVAQLARRGVAIGAHAHTHWPMHAGRSAADLSDEARIARQRIETQVGHCSAFAYPFGTTRDVSRDAWHGVRDAGYAVAFTTLAGTLDGGANPFLLPRYGLHGGETNLASLGGLLRAANPRLSRWQKRLA